MRSACAWVNCLPSSFSFSKVKFCLSSVPTIPCPFWYSINRVCEVSTFICKSANCLESQSAACMVLSNLGDEARSHEEQRRREQYQTGYGAMRASGGLLRHLTSLHTWASDTGFQ